MSLAEITTGLTDGEPWPSLAALNSSGYTGDGPGSRAWYLDAQGVRREAEYVAGAGWLSVASLAALGSPANPYPTTWSAVDRAALAAVSPPGTIVWAANPAVPLGISRLIRNAAATNFVPPAGEVVFDVGNGGSVYRDVTPGSTNLTEVYKSSSDVGAIPLYMLADGAYEIFVSAYAADSASSLATPMVGIGISTAPIATPNGFDYIVSITQSGSQTPGVSGFGRFILPFFVEGGNVYSRDGRSWISGTEGQMNGTLLKNALGANPSVIVMAKFATTTAKVVLQKIIIRRAS